VTSIRQIRGPARARSSDLAEHVLEIASSNIPSKACFFPRLIQGAFVYNYPDPGRL
jgi:hypothetical protein